MVCARTLSQPHLLSPHFTHSPHHPLPTSPTRSHTNTLSLQAQTTSIDQVRSGCCQYRLAYTRKNTLTHSTAANSKVRRQKIGRWNGIDDRSSMINCSNQSTLLKATLGACDTVPQTGQSRRTCGRSHLDVRSSNGQVLGYMEQATSKCRELGT